MVTMELVGVIMIPCINPIHNAPLLLPFQHGLISPRNFGTLSKNFITHGRLLHL